MDIVILQYIIAAFTTITAGALAFKSVRTVLCNIWKFTFGRRGAQLDRIELELKPNGGGSLRDSINRIEEKQNEFEAFLNAQLNINSEATFRTDAAGHVITNNRKHQHLTGFSGVEVAGDGWINVIHPEWREEVFRKWRQAVEAGIEFSEDIMYVNPEGVEYLVHVNAYRERDSQGRIHGYLGTVTPYQEDITPVCPHMDKCKAVLNIQ